MHGLTYLAFALLAIFCWGVYGPILHEGQEALGDGQRLSHWTPFMCVGVAWFLIAVAYPLLMIPHERPAGHWTRRGMAWSLAAGALGALGNLGLILAFVFGGTPVFIMPLVFGFSPVINTVATMIMTRSVREASVLFFLGILVVAIGAAGVMFFQPAAPAADPAPQQVQTPQDQLDAATDGVQGDSGARETNSRFLWMTLCVMVTALCWGSYGPVMHEGQMDLGGSGMRPFLFVGLAYFLIAVAMPLVLQQFLPPDPGVLNINGVAWSLVAGIASAVGSLGVIYAFNAGGNPIFIMPLIFGGAPVVNTLSSTIGNQTLSQLSMPFYLSLFLVIAGSVTVLVCAPQNDASPPVDTT